MSGEIFFHLLKRLNIHVETKSSTSIWRKLFGDQDKNEIDFHTFRSKLRDYSSTNRDYDNFFCGASSYDRASNRRERSKSVLQNVNEAFQQLRDRVLTQERAVMRVFRSYDTDRCGVLEKDTFRKALHRNFHVSMLDVEFLKLWSRISSKRDDVIAYRTVITQLRRGGTFGSNTTSTSLLKEESSSRSDLTAEQILQELKSRNLLRSNAIFRSHVEKKVSLRPIELEQIIHSMNLEGNLRGHTFRTVWNVLDPDGIGKIDIDSLLYFDDGAAAKVATSAGQLFSKTSR